MRRFGSVRLLPSGRYQARIRPTKAPGLTAPETFDTHAEATAWLDGLERERDLCNNFDALGLPRPTSPQQKAPDHG